MYGHSENQEVALLHCKHCTHELYCSEFPSYLTNKVRHDDEEDGLIHLNLNSDLYFKSGKIDWAIIKDHIYGPGPDDL